ncbi:FixH family protein [Flavobacterium sp. CYK-4]|uniref:FixH family protein n=1 Tax=Flavobacterium lotistagni TaxID=2709660 RepID=UPI00140DD0EE|nr:FixH family protein [Flavobacterium lotistagni]NHM07535.1 FixH family protein [Flavobacterium lotistagni]
MKINWGTSIVIAFVLFMSFIFSFIIRVESNPKYASELVVDEYYKKDAHYSEDFAKLQNTERLSQKPIVKSTDEGVSVVFPDLFTPQKIKGKVSLYRPSAKKLDFERSIQLSGSTLLIPKRDFADGNWDMTISWEYEGQSYLMKQKLYIN